MANGSAGVYSLSYDANGVMAQVDFDDQGGTYYYTFWDGNYLYCVNGTALLSYSVDGSGNLTLIESEAVTNASYLYGDGSYVYVVGTAGIYSFSVNGSGQLTQEDHLTYSSYLRYVWVDDSLIFTTTGYSGGGIVVYVNDGTGQLTYKEIIPSEVSQYYWGVWGNSYYLYALNEGGGIVRYQREPDGTYTYLGINTKITDGREITGDDKFLYSAAWNYGLGVYSADLIPLKIYDRKVILTDAELVLDNTNIFKFFTGSLTDGAPTSSEINSIIGTIIISAGYEANIKDSDGTGLVYKVIYDGTNWYTFSGSLAP